MGCGALSKVPLPTWEIERVNALTPLTLRRQLLNRENLTSGKGARQRISLTVQKADGAVIMQASSDHKWGNIEKRRRTLNLNIVSPSSYVFSGATGKLLDESTRKVVASRESMVSTPWAKLCSLWTLETPDGPLALTVWNRRGRTLLVRGKLDMSDEGAALGDNLVASLDHGPQHLYYVTERTLSVDLAQLGKWSDAELSLVCAIAIDPWWTECFPADKEYVGVM